MTRARPGSDDPPRSAPAAGSWLLAVFLLAGVLVLDQMTKVLAVTTLERHPVDLGIVRLAVSRNPGSAFSRFQGEGWVYLFFTAVAIVTVVAMVVLSRPHGRWTGVGLALIVGGAWGNIIDRLVRFPGPPHGRVVDFIDFKFWPVFNVADSAIVVGAGVLLLLGGRGSGPAGDTSRRPGTPAQAPRSVSPE